MIKLGGHNILSYTLKVYVRISAAGLAHMEGNQRFMEIWTDVDAVKSEPGASRVKSAGLVFYC